MFVFTHAYMSTKSTVGITAGKFEDEDKKQGNQDQNNERIVLRDE